MTHTLLIALILLGLSLSPALETPFYDTADSVVEPTDPGQGGGEVNGGMEGEGYTQDDDSQEDPTP